MSFFDLMAAPFAECMVLVAIHTYLGIHVLRRRVIFVDLALAQIAALGTMVGFLFGISPETSAALLVSMVFTFAGAAVFALTRGHVARGYTAEEEQSLIKGAVRTVARVHRERIPQEAVIGLVYAITAAIAVLLVEKTQGGEHLKEIMVGSILWVKWSDVGMAAGAYAVVGALHYLFRRQFFLISENPEEATRQGLSIRAWDFFFYVTFGIVISFSTRVAGVLLVFVFLVAPAIMAFLITRNRLHQLLIGWGMGTAVTLIGLGLSYVADLPSGPSVVSFYGVALTLGALVFAVKRAENRLRALGLVGLGTVAVVCICSGFYLSATWLSTTSLAHSHQHDRTRAAIRHDHEVAAAREARERVRRASVLAASLGSQGTTGRPCRHYITLPDADARLTFVRKLVKQCRRGGLKLLHVLLSDPDTPLFYRSEGRDLLEQVAGKDFGYDPDLEPAANKDALGQLRDFVDKLPRRKTPPPGLEAAAHSCAAEC